VDAALILQFEAALGDLPCPEQGDIKGDGVINSVDAALVLQFDVGLLDSLASLPGGAGGLRPGWLKK
jgi:hypothetical protein